MPQVRGYAMQGNWLLQIFVFYRDVPLCLLSSPGGGLRHGGHEQLECKEGCHVRLYSSAIGSGG